jgi:hypothetical protein
MDMFPTLVLAAGFLAVTILFGWLGARPPNLSARPRLIPWRLLMLLAFVAMIAVLVHAVALLRATNGSSPS